MKQTILDEYTQKTRFFCERCNRSFKSAKGLNIHLSKKHAGDTLPPLYTGEGIKDIRSEGRYVDLRLCIKRTLWTDIKRAALSEKIKPEQAIISALLNMTVYGAKNGEEVSYIS